MSTELIFKFNRNGYAGPLQVVIKAEAPYGAQSADGLGAADGNPAGIIDDAGLLKLPALPTNQPYTLPCTAPGSPKPPLHRLTVIRGKNPIGSITFYPVLAAVGDTTLDLNELVAEGEAQVATREQLIALGTGLAALDTKLPLLDQSLADNEESRVLLLDAVNVVRYTTNTARNAASPPDGTWGWAADQKNYRHREGGAWVSYDPAPPPPDTGGY
ncbi:hypothetical protein DKM44_02360 [Deinococcus irradiatisoli]|uniref:Uncharacterized protein n=1 Tax=Deinococcus irradiatisoli TaxID=2202254 RepID=A0A2Z3JFS9_9DEIO|nr:hypothetical protein [Deinococcus irradiatisoli]AWN22220.1 hypothetical protein DKM44_02360 [Deinococcus irradiatisoli]